MEKDIVSKVDKHLGSVHELAYPYGASISHNPLTKACEVFNSCGDSRGRKLLHRCTEKELSGSIKEMLD